MKVLFKLPKISRVWAVAIVMACVMAGGLVLLLLPPPRIDQNTIVLVEMAEDTLLPEIETPRVDLPPLEPTTIHKKEIESPQLKQEMPSENVSEIASAPQTKTPAEPLKKIDKIIVKKNPIEEAVQAEETVSKAEPERIPPVAAVSSSHRVQLEKSLSTPSYNADYLEKRQDKLRLPIKGADGLGPFDVYQRDFFTDSTKTYLTIIISELGEDAALFQQIKSFFSKEVTCAFLVNSPASEALHKEARDLGHETLLMLPMEPMAYPQSDPGPGTLLTNALPQENRQRLEHHLSHLTGYVGVMPYMGGRFLRVKPDLKPILSEIHRRGLAYFEPRFARSHALECQPTEMRYVKGNYDIVRGSSLARIRGTLKQVVADLSQKNPVVLTVQADKVALRELQKWLPKVVSETVVLAPLSAVVE